MNKLWVWILVLSGLWACTAQPDEGSEDSKKESPFITQAEGARILSAEIDSIENVVFVNDSPIDIDAARDLLHAYEKYVERYGGDNERGPEYLYKAAAVNRGLNQPVEAILLYDKILKKYPDYARGPEVAFLTGFTYEADLGEVERAKEAYEYVIEEFADDKWADDARARLATIDMTDEELIRSFKEKNEQQD